MPDDPRRDAAFYDHEKESRRHVADWGGDDVFARVPRRRPVHSLPPQHHRRPAPLDPLHRPAHEPPGHALRTDEVGSTPPDSRGTARHWDDPASEETGRFARQDEGRFGRGEGGAGGRFARGDEERFGRGEGGAGGRFARGDAVGEERRLAPGAAAGEEGRFAWAEAVRLAEGFGSERSGDGKREPVMGVSEDDLAAAARARGFNVSTPEERGGPTTSTPGTRGRQTVVITGRPEGVARTRPLHDRSRSVADRVGPRPERIVAWAFALGLLLILLAVATADAATL